jgi:CRP/FNR family cyclic AMP-dependent transcriptional regulator
MVKSRFFRQLPVRPVRKRERPKPLVQSLSSPPPRLVAVVVNCEHLDDVALGGYDSSAVQFLEVDCGRWAGMLNERALGFSHAVIRKTFRAGMTVRNCRDNEVVFSQGDKADAVFYIQSGTVKLTAVSTNRRKAIIAVLQRGSFFGEGCLAGQSLRICTARSIGESDIIRLRKTTTVRTLKRDPQFATLFVSYLLSRVIRIEEDLVDQFFNFSERRLARVLLLFGQISKESKAKSPLKISQSTLAEMVGTTRARISKFMNGFRKKGFVSYNGSMQINKALLTAFLLSRPMSVVTKT